MSHGRTDERDERANNAADSAADSDTDSGARDGAADMTWEIAQVSRADPPQADTPLAPLIEARLDLGRASRKGIPEVVLAESKRDDQLVAIVRAFLETSGYAIVSRARHRQLDLLARELPMATMDIRELAHAAALHAPGYKRPRTGGHIGILTAGAGDAPIAEE
ncbi:MAG TPA: hypothetical protein VE338_03735, partial [Ktedonobacterales bacterium]|nr:hypothetical protein [Ktedonobacterales bacterium]